MKHNFKLERGGRTYSLVKHPRDRKGADVASAPWYIRIRKPDGKWTWKKAGEHFQLEAAVDYAKELITQSRAGAHPYEQLTQSISYRNGLTVGSLAADWVKLGYPVASGRPRTQDQIEEQEPNLTRAIRWWGDKPVIQVGGKLFQDYAAYRRETSRNGCGERCCDLELSTLSNCCRWAQGRGIIDRNPFEKRPRFRVSSDIQHCHAASPANDEELHLLCGTLMGSENPMVVVVGAQLLFQALTGLRPGEPGMLRRGATGPGRRYTVTLDGITSEQMEVWRQKHGMNPAVRIHPALAEFLTHWAAWLDVHFPGTPVWFPDPADPSRSLVPSKDGSKRLNHTLSACVQRLGLQPRRPHGMRAYYVKVRRSQGLDDSRIALELGERSGAGMIVQNYGEATQAFGTGQFDWLPAGDQQPAWAALGRSENIVALQAVNH